MTPCKPINPSNTHLQLPRGVNDRWTTDPLGDSDPLQPLALGDTCTFFGCYEYTEEYTNSETFTIHSNITVANFNPTSCIIDKDECSDGTAQCEYECINMMTGTANSYQCTCRKGFSLSDDQHNCIDVDECTAEELNNCDQMCTVTGDGWYNCSCEDGFTLDQDNHTCNGGFCVCMCVCVCSYLTTCVYAWLFMCTVYV
jgi:hypothetical protein